jgi:hypothetical protein
MTPLPTVSVVKVAATLLSQRIAALRARRHCTSAFRTDLPALLAAFEHKNHRAEAPICQGRKV